MILRVQTLQEAWIIILKVSWDLKATDFHFRTLTDKKLLQHKNGTYSYSGIGNVIGQIEFYKSYI